MLLWHSDRTFKIFSKLVCVRFDQSVGELSAQERQDSSHQNCGFDRDDLGQ